ncbi:hypothetical protein KEM48_013405 [Puccinia striiformis f. sp. tritici PST-130]|nr:hypothetical protein KEM48_013405 [Puccinia striiformis f. sp. tritici PST-130]
MDLRASRITSYTKTKSESSSYQSSNSSTVTTYNPTNPYFAGSVQVNTPSLVLNREHVVTNVPQVRRYDWVVANKSASFDGFLRNVFVINNQFPGPLIEANEVISIPRRHNCCKRQKRAKCPSQHPLARHLSKRYSMDGCLEPSAHYGALLADGVSGPLIIHSPRDPLVRGRDYDNDQILFINDWYHDPSTTITRKLLSTEGYNGTLAAPSPNTALLNGIGFFNCEKYADGKTCQTNYSPLEIQVPPKQRSRIRLIQAGSHALFKVSVDGHALEVIEADATPVRSSKLFHRVSLHNAERYSVILDTASDSEGDSFHLRAVMDTDCFAPGMDTVEGNTALAVVRVSSKPLESGNIRARMPAPTTQDWSDEKDGPCVDLDQSKLAPRINPNLNSNSLGRVYYNTSFGTIIDRSKKGPSNALGRFFVDNTTYISRESQPLLPQLMSGGSGALNMSEVATQTISQPGIWDVVVNNLDQRLTTLSTSTVLIHVVPGGSYLVMRIKADNPGVWIIHCHIDWHLAAGFAGVLVIQPDALKQATLPPANQGLCPKGGSGQNS